MKGEPGCSIRSHRGSATITQPKGNRSPQARPPLVPAALCGAGVGGRLHQETCVPEGRPFLQEKAHDRGVGLRLHSSAPPTPPH